jgi:Co/Zn/Cd efflux system component
MKPEEPTGEMSSKEYDNHVVLGVTCLCFGLFAVAEMIGAIASNSLSLLGDAGAMLVDV